MFRQILDFHPEVRASIIQGWFRWVHHMELRMAVMINEQELLKIVTERLQKGGIPYMVTGSVAANFYTTPRMTRDIDIIVELEQKRSETLVSLFSKDFVVDRELIESAIRRKAMFNIIHREGVLKIDFIVRKDTEFRRLEFERRRYIEFEGIGINVVSPEDLILSKLSLAKESGSEMQINDVKNLMRTVSDLDRDYIEKWVESLGLQNIFQKVRS